MSVAARLRRERRTGTQGSDSFSGRWHRLVEPGQDGLPTARVLLWFPLLVLLVFAVAVLTGVSGSSMGMWHLLMQGTPDPNVIAGEPRPIRQDEWMVQGSWLLSQASQGFPTINHVFPGGQNATLMNDVPTWDWSTALRPHLWGPLVLGLDEGVAWRWWFPAAAMIAAAYAFVVSMLPRRPVLGAMLALAVLFQPFVQWWWMPVLTLALAFAFTTMTAVVWAMRSTRRSSIVGWALLASFSAVTMAMSIYPPFILAVAYPVVAFALGLALCRWRNDGMSGRRVLRRLLPLAAGGVAAVAVMVVWLLTRRDAVEAMLNTIYPGKRSVPPGTGTTADLVGLLSGPFQQALTVRNVEGLGTNQSTASTPLVLSLFLVLPMLWLLVARWRARREVDWLVLALVAVQVFVLAFMFVPGWDDVARLFLLDRAQVTRMRASFVPLLVMSFVVVVHRVGEGSRVPWAVAVPSAAVVPLAGLWVWRWLENVDSPVVPSWYALALIVLLALAVLLVVRGRGTLAGAAVLVASLVIGWGVNPLYKGVFDVRADTAVGREIAAIAEREPEGAWVGVGTKMAMSTVFASGVHGYSGVQTYPPMKMWEQIDPYGEGEQAWNRLAHIQWFAGRGDPRPRTVQGYADVVHVTFDSCAPFAQRYVSYVLVDGPDPGQRCLRELNRFDEGMTGSMGIYEVLPR